LTARELPGNCQGTAWELPGNCPGTAGDSLGSVILFQIAEYMYKSFFKTFSLLRCLRCVSPNFIFDSRMLHLCGYLSVGQLCNGKWLNIPFYFNNEWSRNYRIRSRKLYRVYQKKVHSWKKFTKIRCARHLRKLSVSLCTLTFSGTKMFRVGKL
jgi:hypothetical protein